MWKLYLSIVLPKLNLALLAAIFAVNLAGYTTIYFLKSQLADLKKESVDLNKKIPKLVSVRIYPDSTNRDTNLRVVLNDKSCKLNNSTKETYYTCSQPDYIFKNFIGTIDRREIEILGTNFFNDVGLDYSCFGCIDLQWNRNLDTLSIKLDQMPPPLVPSKFKEATYITFQNTYIFIDFLYNTNLKKNIQ